MDLVAAGLDSFGRPEGYVRRQIDGWCRRWADSATPDTVDVGATMQWLHDNMPTESGKASVIHNDYKLDNVIFSADNPLEVIGVLDGNGHGRGSTDGSGLYSGLLGAGF